MKKDYTDVQTAAYRAKQRSDFNNFRTSMRLRGHLIEIKYPETATSQQRGFTPSGSAKLHFYRMS